MMYNPSPFKVNDIKKIVDFIRSENFGIMFSSVDGKLASSSVPMAVNSECTVLRGHLAKANNMWRNLDGKQVLVAFEGPNHYISPEWYGEEVAVPTWNYVSVQINGKFRIRNDEKDQMDILDELVDLHEKKVYQNWKVDWGDHRYSRMLNGIVAFEITVESVEGKWKLSQNHPKENRILVAKKLRSLNNPDASSIADLMEGVE